MICVQMKTHESQQHPLIKVAYGYDEKNIILSERELDTADR